MPLNETQQIDNLIKKSHHILITFKKDFSIDAVSSALALALILQKLNKLVDVVCGSFVLPKNLRFLKEAENIKTKLNNLQKFIINVEVGQDKIDTFSYSVEGDKLKIFLTPKEGSFSPEDISSEQAEYKYDLIFVLDSPDFDSLGSVFNKATEFFYNTDIINIDHHSDNEQFGQVNLTNFNAVATSEIVYQLISQLDEKLIDADVATALLTGLITKTKSFKTANVTPKTLEIAGQLINLQADREKIIKSLYRSRTLATLNLWGRVLARLRNNGDQKLVWSLLTENDFIESRADEQDLPEVIDELISFMPELEIAVLFYHYKNDIKVLVQTLKNQNALQLTQDFKPQGSKNLVSFSLSDASLAEAEKIVIDNIKEKMK